MRCLVCGTSDTTCGAPYTGTPVDAQMIEPPIRKEAQMANEMILVEHNGGRFRVNPRDLDTYMEQHPGATRVDDGAEAEEPEAKAVDGPAENKARTMGTTGGKK